MYLEFMVILVYCNMMLYASRMELFFCQYNTYREPSHLVLTIVLCFLHVSLPAAARGTDVAFQQHQAVSKRSQHSDTPTIFTSHIAPNSPP
jgi:hypothetical protein